MRTILKYSGFAVTTLWKQGVWHATANLVAEIAFDLGHGVETIVPREVEADGLANSEPSDAVQYQGANPRLVRALLRTLPPTARKARFVDFGCGKGRALLLAAEAGFTRLIGIERSPALAKVTEQNLQRSRRLAASVGREVLCMDAQYFSLPAGPLVLFFYNPFNGETLDCVVTNVQARMLAEADDLWVVYLNPKGLATFRAAGLKVCHELRRHGELLGAVLKAQ